MPKRKSLLPIQDHSLYPDVVSFLQANREACLKSLLADNDPFTLRHLFAWVTILAALMGIWSLANNVVDESLRKSAPTVAK